MIKGVKTKTNSDETFLVLEERNDYQDQVASISIITDKGKNVADCLHLFNDGSVAFAGGIPKEQMCNVGESGRLVYNGKLEKDQMSERPIEKFKKHNIKTLTFKNFPLTGVRSCDCKKHFTPYKYSLIHSNGSCPGYAALQCVNALTGSATTTILNLYYDGLVEFQSGGIFKGMGFDASASGKAKIRGDKPTTQ